MAWTATDNFESYANGNSLDTKSGGSGWNGNWSVGGGTWTITNSTAANGTTLSVTATRSSATNFFVNRALNSITVGEFYFYVRKDSTAGSWYLNLSNSTSYGSGNLIVLGMESSDIVAYNNSTRQALVTSFTTSTWYKIKVKFGHVTDKFAVSINDAAYSADFSFSFGGTGAITNYQIYEGGGTTPSTFYFDEIAPVSGATTQTITSFKSLLGVGA